MGKDAVLVADQVDYLLRSMGSKLMLDIVSRFDGEAAPAVELIASLERGDYGRGKIADALAGLRDRRLIDKRHVDNVLCYVPCGTLRSLSAHLRCWLRQCTGPLPGDREYVQREAAATAAVRAHASMPAYDRTSQVLKSIAAQPGITRGQIALDVPIDKRTMRRLLAKLVADHAVRFTVDRDASHRRRYYLAGEAPRASDGTRANGRAGQSPTLKDGAPADQSPSPKGGAPVKKHPQPGPLPSRERGRRKAAVK